MPEITTINELAIMLKNHIDSEKERHDNFDEKLGKIEVQTTKTNGTVKGLLLWKARIVGGLAVLTAIVIPVAYMVISSHHK